MAGSTTQATTSDGSTVTIVVEPAPADPERIADMGALWSLFLVAALAIFCMRRLSDLFRFDQND